MLTVLSALVATFALISNAAGASLYFRVAERSDPSARSNLLANVYATCVKPNQVALTFDDGPYIYMRHIVDTLNNASVPGTFFVNGNYEDTCIYSSARASDLQYAVNMGHEIGQHTWSHSRLTRLGTSAIRTEFSKINTAIQKITGLTPALMRPPFGEYNSAVRQVAKQNGLSVVIWDQDSGDSFGASIVEQKAEYSNFIKKRNQHAIFSNSELYKSTAYTLLPHTIAELKKGGYQFVTVSQCLGKHPYQSVTKPSKRDSTWHC